MENLPVTLIVKAPNQQIEDQTVHCELSWTINKLKQHLSEVYPNKPAKHEQKLIYSGQLLNDTQLLKDVLRQYEGQETHTLHLVCKPKKEPIPTNKNTMPNNNSNNVTTTENGNSNNDNNNSDPGSAGDQSTTTNSTTSTLNNVQNFGNMGVPWMPEGMQMNPQYAAHMAVMQQAYIQYINQYMQLAANSYGNSQFYSAASPGVPTPVDRTSEVARPRVQPQAAQQPQLQQQAAAAAAVRDPELAERDWLDNFYLISRLLVLFSVVFFYSSFLRFALVLILGTAVYLYQVGFFRQQQQQQNNAGDNLINNNNNVGGQAAARPPQESSTEARDEGQEGDHAIAAPSRLTLVWTFFTTFFASLLPEVPNAV